MRAVGSFATARSGSAAVEFAIIAPVFFMLLAGLLAYGIYFSAEHAVQQISADAARAAIAGVDDEERRQLVDDFIDRQAGHYAFIRTEFLNVKIEDDDAGVELVVTIGYDASHLPIWALWQGLPMPGQVIEKQAAIRLGGL